jgi:hypothetical protein
MITTIGDLAEELSKEQTSICDRKTAANNLGLIVGDPEKVLFNPNRDIVDKALAKLLGARRFFSYDFGKKRIYTKKLIAGTLAKHNIIIDEKEADKLVLAVDTMFGDFYYFEQITNTESYIFRYHRESREWTNLDNG